MGEVDLIGTVSKSRKREGVRGRRRVCSVDSGEGWREIGRVWDGRNVDICGDQLVSRMGSTKRRKGWIDGGGGHTQSVTPRLYV